MNDRIAGSILLSASGLVVVLGIAGAQIAQAIVLAGFYAGNLAGAQPLTPQQASPHWIVVPSALVLAAVVLSFLLRREAPKASEAPR
jgi:hypothetical protein